MLKQIINGHKRWSGSFLVWFMHWILWSVFSLKESIFCLCNVRRIKHCRSGCHFK